MPAHTNSCHILGIRILTVIMHNNSSSLWLRINKSKSKNLKLKLKGSRADMDAEEFVNRITTMMQS